MKAIFFDRDDTLINDSGYMFKPEQLDIFKDTIPTLTELKERGFSFFIVTNQSGIGRGYFNLEQMNNFNKHMTDVFKKGGIEFIDIAYCPHSPEDHCDCRKPSAKLINDLCEKYHVQKELSYMVGDKDSDKEAGDNAFVKGIKLEPGKIKSLLDIIC